MKLLVITQKVHKNDSNLGFFHVWLERLAESVDHLYVICLEKGEYQLDEQKVTILSLGKERGSVSSFIYALRFYRALFSLRGQYDAVFVHMNPEYVILGGLWWRLTGKKVLLWYLHKAVNLRLWLAEKLVTKIFTASEESFRLPSKKVEIVGHGIPVEIFSRPQEQITDQRELWLLTVGRISLAKDLETVIKAVEILRNQKTVPTVRLAIYGSTVTAADQKYKENLKQLVSTLAGVDGSDLIGFRIDQHVHYDEMPGVYHRYQIFIHTSRTGSLDKVVLEALAAGRVVITSSEAFFPLASGSLKDVVYSFPPGDYQALAKKIATVYESGRLQHLPSQAGSAYVRANHNLDSLVAKIVRYLSN